MSRSPRGGAARWTLTLSGVLAVIAVALTWHADSEPILTLDLPTPVLALMLAALFLLAEQFLMNVEFRRQAHSLTLAGVPLVLGVLLVSPQTFVIARLAAAMIAFILQRINFDKILYNGAAYACEAALDATIVHLWLSQRDQIDLWTVAVVLTVVAGVDQLMSLLVLSLIRLHNGPLSPREVADVLVSAAALSAVSCAFAVIVLLLLGNGALGAGLVVLVIAVGAGAYRGHASTRRRHQALTLIHEFVSDGVGAESLEQLAGQLLSRIRQLLRAATVEVMIVDGQLANLGAARSDAEPTAALTLTIGEDENLMVGRRTVDYSDWIAVRALIQEEPTLAARTTKDRGLRRWLLERGVRDAVVVALPLSSGSAGTLTVMDRLGETATFVEDDLTLLQTLTGHLAVAIRSTRLVEKLGYDATHDSLTGLSNRAHLSEQINLVLSTGTGAATVLLLDLDRFKEVNDILGHDVGDRLLKVVADRLRGCLPAYATVARLGGDEFAVLLPGVDDAAELAELVADTLAEPVRFEEAMLTPESSVGVAVTNGLSAQPDLLRQADTAMYEAKANDRRVAVYGPEMDRGRIERLALVADLRMALSDHPEQMLLHYQPKIDLQTGMVTGVEALVRWAHPTLGVLGPDRFIPLAESTGLIEGLTPLVLEAGLAECRKWTADGYPISVAVNLSARNISDPRLPDRVAAAIARIGLPADRVILEITESSVMGDPAQTLPVLHQLRDLGVCLSLDDFGTGYSSLSYLQRLPVGEVKIDRSFVQGLSGENRSSTRALIKTIIGLGADLNLRIVAEGVEDLATLDELRGLGCQVAQGYYISRPMAGADLHKWLGRAAEAAPRLRLLSVGS
ncbi:putative bifunctional diguanylate cyclase/phosphodiesterase [Jatrophihabitans sp.]|jgi:diguanylate cyclase (GGDEF)-like protein|uniref:putative bifunctional diguanylate cyclase/phosphodiesterase n=1 Tax=Jatrophihabitans sp. TaxID=1932789 RepID=UPI0038CDBE75